MRYVVSKRVAGLGSCLISLLRAWNLARSTDRTLVIDWRQSTYLPDKADNLFCHLFRNRTEIAGVPIITGDALPTLLFPEPFYPPAWSQDSIHRFPDRYYPSDALDAANPEIRFSRAEQYALCTRGHDHDAPTLVFHHGLRDGETVQRHFPDMPHPDVVKMFFDDLREAEGARSMAEQFAEAHFDRRPVIGLHIRHGNGEFTNRSRSRLGKDPQLMLEKCKVALQSLEPGLGTDGTLFLCSDSTAVYRCFTQRAPHLVSFQKRMLPAGAGALHMGEPGIDAANAALAEMLLLARCDALIHTESQFTFYPLFKNPSLRSMAIGHIEPVESPAEGTDN